jgi:hypothetical protein
MTTTTAIDGEGTNKSADVYTRRLIVTLPDVSGEEADSVAEAIDTEVLTDGFTSHGTVTHALGLTVPDGIRVMVRGLEGHPAIFIQQDDDTIMVMADEARQLAGVLLAHAHTIDGE